MKPLGICRRLTEVAELCDGWVGQHEFRKKASDIKKLAMLVQALLSFKVTSINFDICGREHLLPIVINHCLSDYSECSQPVTDEPHEAILLVHGLGRRCTSSS